MPPKWKSGRPPKDLDAVRVCVCGTRTFDRPNLLFRWMDFLTVRYELVEVVLGSDGWFSKALGRKTGADYWGTKWAEREWWDRQFFFPDWLLGKKGGPVRNSDMAKHLRPGTDDLCVAFRVRDGESDGTDDMVAKATKRLGPDRVRVIHYKELP